MFRNRIKAKVKSNIALARNYSRIVPVTLLSYATLVHKLLWHFPSWCPLVRYQRKESQQRTVQGEQKQCNDYYTRTIHRVIDLLRNVNGFPLSKALYLHNLACSWTIWTCGHIWAHWLQLPHKNSGLSTACGGLHHSWLKLKGGFSQPRLLDA